MLQLSGVSRRFGDVQALEDVGFTVRPGRLTGFVGGNGAGKTTAMRIVVGVLAPDAGTVTLDGKPLDAPTRRTFGYMPEERGLYPRMKVAEQLAYLARLHGIDRVGAERRARELLERLDLTDRADDRLDALSLGNQQRAQIAAALVHEPRLLVLDEPFSGLDPIAVDTVAAVLTERARAGAPVLFSSHQLDVVERLCDDLVIIAGGRIVAAGEREQLQAAHTEPRHRIRTGGDLGWLGEVPGVQLLESSDGQALFRADEPAAQRVLAGAMARGPVQEFAPVRPSLAEVFREVIRDEEPRTGVAA
jgi:ABC-2 type transport system ATP-binding protein